MYVLSTSDKTNKLNKKINKKTTLKSLKCQ